LASCHRESLRLARAHGVTSIAFPAISCGIYGYPVDNAAHIAVTTIADALRDDAAIIAVTFACFDRTVLEAFRAALRTLIPTSG
jgi:O-acetyl-ADP-ribose deacetylase (regulator of RNase III)